MSHCAKPASNRRTCTLFHSWSPVYMQISEKEEAQQQVTSLESQVQSHQADSSAKIKELQAAGKIISTVLLCLL